MKKLIFVSVLFFSIQTLIAQPEDPKQLNETALNFIRSGDYDNAILVLNRALQQDKNSLELQKSLVMAYYYKRDFEKALTGVKVLVDRDDADVMTYQIAGNVYKALEEVKECDKMYKKALKKFPTSGPLYSEYGELLWAAKDFSAINQWEKGIQVDPAFSGNYYNAAQHYFYTQDKVWALVYGEIFVNLESFTGRTSEIKNLLLDGYKKIYTLGIVTTKGKTEFEDNMLEALRKQSSLTGIGINAETLTAIRTRFILDWNGSSSKKYPFRLFELHRQLLQEGLFDSYNQWLFGSVDNISLYQNWTTNHSAEYSEFNKYQRNRLFKLPTGQYYNK